MESMRMKIFLNSSRAFGLRFLSVSKERSAVCWPKPSYGPVAVQRTEKINGTRIAGAKPLGAQVGACTVMFQAGSRYEVDDQLGATHFLRVGSGGHGKKYSDYMKATRLQHHGAYLSCSSDRQSISYTLRCPPPLFRVLKDFLVDAVKNHHYKWEIDDRRQQVFDDLNRVSGTERVVDLIQKASFAGSLANSVFCEEYRASTMTEKAIRKFKSQHFRSNACSVTSVGMPFEETLSVADEVELRYDEKLKRTEISSLNRPGFETYDYGPGSTTWIAIAVPGCGSRDICCLLKHAVLAAACGTGHTGAGQHDTDRVMQAPLGALGGDDVFTSFRAFNISYCETGLFGILAQTRSSTSKQVALQAVDFLRNINKLSCEQIQTGQQRLKLNLAIHDQDCVKYSEGLALQAVNCVELDNVCDAITMIDQICPEDVSYLAEIIAGKCSQMSIAIAGDVDAAPHDGDLR